MSDTHPAPTSTGNGEIVSTRVIDAPRDRVFQAFADPEHLAQWWGPSGFTNTIQEFDFRPGGAWRIVMHGPGGVDYGNESVFIEVAAPERIVLDHLDPVHQFRLTAAYEDLGNQTRLTWRMRFDSVEEGERVRRFVQDANEQNFDRLEAELEKMRISGSMMS